VPKNWTCSSIGNFSIVGGRNACGVAKVSVFGPPYI